MHAICPACEQTLGLGTSGTEEGIKNLIAQHLRTQKCNTAKAKLDKSRKQTKQTSLLGFMKQKPTKVPPTVQAPSPLAPASSITSPMPQRNPVASSLRSAITSPRILTPPPSITPVPHTDMPMQSEHPPHSVALHVFKAKILRLDPLSVPTATEKDPIAVFACDPLSYIMRLVWISRATMLLLFNEGSQSTS